MKKLILLFLGILILYNTGISQIKTQVQKNKDFAMFVATPKVTSFPNSNISIENLSDVTMDSYVWTFGDGTMVIDNEYHSNYSHYYNGWGVYYITLTVFYNGENYGSMTDSVIVSMPKPIIVGSTDDNIICNDNGEFYAPINFATNYKWYFNENPILDTGLYVGTNTNHLTIITPNEAYIGEYYCIGSNDSGYVSTDTANLIIGETVHAEFVATPTVASYPNSTITIENISDTNLDIYSLDFGDGNTQIEYTYISNYSHFYEPGIYTITMEVSNNQCTDTYTSTVTIFGTLPLTEKTNSISITPNPVNDYMQIKGINGESQITIYSIAGKYITTENISENQEIYIGNLQSGIYFVSIMEKDKTYFLKLIKD